MLPQVVYKPCVDLCGIADIGKTLFLGKGVSIEPWQQLQIESHTLIAVLRSMDVEVVHGRYDKLSIVAAQVGHLRRVATLRHESAHVAYHARVVDSYISLLKDFEPLWSSSPHEIASVYGHGSFGNSDYLTDV